MLIFEKSENTKHFKKCITDIKCKEVVPMGQSVHNCMKIFNHKYGDIPSWKKSVSDQSEWLSYLSTLAKDSLEKEMIRKQPFGTTSGVYMTIFFFKAVMMNECAQTINTMADYIEKFNQIGHRISHNIVEPNEFSTTTPLHSSLSFDV